MPSTASQPRRESTRRTSDGFDVAPVDAPRRLPPVPTSRAPLPQMDTDFGTEPVPTGGLPIVSSVVLLVLGGAAFAYSSSQGVLLGRIAAPILTMAAMHGLWRGGFFKLILLPFAFCVPYLAAVHADTADPVVRAVVGSSTVFINSVVMGGAGFVVLLIARALVKRFRRRHVATRRFALTADRVIGTGVGLA